MFIAQAGHESAGFTRLVESFNYSVEALKKTFGKRLTPYQCEMLGRIDDRQVAHQPQIANLVYGGRMGNKDAGDGWKYRGRGLIQIPAVMNITGRQRRRISLLMKIFREKPDPFFLSFISCF